LLADDQKIDYLRKQVLTSRNVAGGRWVDFLLGGLNYQIEHHLFPSMPRPNLRRAQALVHQFRTRCGIPTASAACCAPTPKSYATCTPSARHYAVPPADYRQRGGNAGAGMRCPIGWLYYMVEGFCVRGSTRSRSRITAGVQPFLA
jgi:hypothetical protein